jgi:FkbM family methyltransferase
MANRRLQALEKRFRIWRDRGLGHLLFGLGSTRKAFMRYIGGRGDLVLRSLSDHRIVLDPADHTVSATLMGEGVWQRAQLDGAISFLQQHGLLAENSLFIDVGANIGTQTIYALVSGAFAGAVAIEPEPRNFDILQLNVLVNGLAERVTCHKCGAGEKEDELLLGLEWGNRAAHSFVRPTNQSAQIAVPVKRLDDLLAARPSPVGLVWIDVEGFEPSVLRGMESLMRQGTPVVVETNPHLYKGGIADLTGLLAPHYSHFVDLGSTQPSGRPLDEMGTIAWQHDLLLYRRRHDVGRSS